MVITVKKGTEEAALRMLAVRLRVKGVGIAKTEGTSHTILTLVGDTWQLDPDSFLELPYVEDVKRITPPYHLVARATHPEPTVVTLGDARIGQDFCLIAGPCAVESLPQIVGVAHRVKESGARVLRGGAFKPRTSPYDFQGLKADGIELLMEAKRETGLPIVTEIMNANHLPLFEGVDVIQVGARNMQNFELLKELGRTKKPILIKRGLANTIKELLMSAEYIMAGGNENIILCERGVRTFETATRNTLDLSAVPVLHELTHLPVVIDPSHATGVARYVKPMAMAAAACGADGLIIEVHNDPPHALCDGAQSLRPEQFEDVAKAIRAIRATAMEFAD